MDLVQRIERILALEKRGAFAELVSEELFESLIELHTPICASVADAERELRRLRAHGLATAPPPACGSARPARIPSACSSASV